MKRSFLQILFVLVAFVTTACTPQATVQIPKIPKGNVELPGGKLGNCTDNECTTYGAQAGATIASAATATLNQNNDSVELAWAGGVDNGKTELTFGKTGTTSAVVVTPEKSGSRKFTMEKNVDYGYNLKVMDKDGKILAQSQGPLRYSVTESAKPAPGLSNPRSSNISSRNATVAVDLFNEVSSVTMKANGGNPVTATLSGGVATVNFSAMNPSTFYNISIDATGPGGTTSSSTSFTTNAEGSTQPVSGWALSGEQKSSNKVSGSSLTKLGNKGFMLRVNFTSAQTFVATGARGSASETYPSQTKEFYEFLFPDAAVDSTTGIASLKIMSGSEQIYFTNINPQ